MSITAQTTSLAPLVTEFNKSDALAMPAVQSPGLVDIPSLTTFTAPEYIQMVNLLKSVIHHIVSSFLNICFLSLFSLNDSMSKNDIINLLDHPKENKTDLSELIYTLATIRSFKVRVIECNHVRTADSRPPSLLQRLTRVSLQSLEAANVTASAWLFSVSAQLAGVNKDLAQVQEHIHETEDSIAKNLRLIQDNIKAFTSSVSTMQERHMLEGSDVAPNQDDLQVKTLKPHSSYLLPLIC